MFRGTRLKTKDLEVWQNLVTMNRKKYYKVKEVDVTFKFEDKIVPKSESFDIEESNKN